jgi:hypothetical protein
MNFPQVSRCRWLADRGVSERRTPLGAGRIKEVNELATYAINGPRHHNVETVPLQLLKHFIEAGSIFSPPASAYPGVGEGLTSCHQQTLLGVRRESPSALIVARHPIVTFGRFLN